MQTAIILVIATRNQGKTAEIRELLQDYPIKIKNLDDFGPIPHIEEDGETFDENAYKKASFAARVLAFPLWLTWLFSSRVNSAKVLLRGG